MGKGGRGRPQRRCCKSCWRCPWAARLPEIALCLLLCCVATGYIVLRVEQKEQYHRDTFEVYLQEHGQQAVTAQTAPPQSEPAQAAQEEVNRIGGALRCRAYIRRAQRQALPL